MSSKPAHTKIQELQKDIEELRRKERSGISGVHPDVLSLCESIVNALDATLEAAHEADNHLRELIAKSPAFITEIVKLDVKPGDVLIAKLGDPNTGWIPGPEHEEKLLELFKEATIDLGASCFVYHYGVQFEKLSGERQRELIKNGLLETPIHIFEGHHYFWNETYSDRIGPFEDRDACARALRKYAQEL
jgi:hypothetical protein